MARRSRSQPRPHMTSADSFRQPRGTLTLTPAVQWRARCHADWVVSPPTQEHCKVKTSYTISLPHIDCVCTLTEVKVSGTAVGPATAVANSS